MAEGHSPEVTAAPALQGLAVPADRVGQLAAARGLPVWPEPVSVAAAGPPPRVLLLLGPAAPALSPLLWQPPHAAWIDVAELGDEAVIGLIVSAESCSLFCSVSSAKAHQLPLAYGLANAVAARRPISSTTRNDIELALHEAITNALIHGNLEIAGLSDLSVAALERFARGVADRVADPHYAARRIEISCRIADNVATFEIGDQGPGFVPVRGRDDAASGRGLALIAALTLSYQLLDGGRRICMKLALS